MNPNALNIDVIGIVAVAISLLMVPITVHGQSLELPPPLFDHEQFLADREDRQLRELAPPLNFNERVFFFVQDIEEAFTFDPVARAELKLEHAQEHQTIIDDLDSRGLAIPIEFEQRRIDKLTEASEILQERLQDTPAVADERLPQIIESFETLRTMGELNDIRILVSQLPSVVNAPEAVKQQFNAKVNSLRTWQQNCEGEFDIDAILPLRSAIDKIELQCPKLLELQEQFGRERIRLLVSGQA